MTFSTIMVCLDLGLSLTGRGKNTAATAHGVLADGVVLDANYALQTRAADQPTLGRRGGGASAARARQ